MLYQKGKFNINTGDGINYRLLSVGQKRQQYFNTEKTASKR